MSDPEWPRAADWLAGEHHDDADASIAVLGAPLHKASISPSRADLAPSAIRGALRRFCVMDVAGRRDLRAVAALDAGDVPLADSSPEEALAPLGQRVAELREGADVVVVLGGDNSVTRPVLHGVAPLDSSGLVTFDAHFDLRDTSDGLTNGNPIRALLADGFPGERIVQIGIQSFANSPRHAELARESGIRVVGREEVADRGIKDVVSRELARLAGEANVIYVDFDIDVLDRAFAPATPGSRPGGLSPLELAIAAALCGSHPAVAAADIVEVSPPDDVGDATVMAAARVLLAFASGVAARARRP